MYQSIYFYINIKRNTNHLGNEYQVMEKKRLIITNIYNSIFSMVVLIPILQLFTIYCNRKQIHYLFFFLVSAFKCQINSPRRKCFKSSHSDISILIMTVQIVVKLGNNKEHSHFKRTKVHNLPSILLHTLVRWKHINSFLV